MNIQNLGMNMNLKANPTTFNYPYQERTFLSTLSPKYQESLSKGREGGCCCTCGKGIKGNIIFLIVMCVFSSALSFIAKFTALSRIDEYKYLQEIITLKIEEEDKLLMDYYEEYNPNLFRFDKFWNDFGYFEDKILFADIICPIILLIFLIIELIIYNFVLKKETKSGYLRGILIFFNCLFYVLFNILFTLLIYLMIYSYLISYIKPSYFSGASYYSNLESEWKKNSFDTNLIIHNIIVIILIVFFCLLTLTDKTIFFLLEMYNEDDDNNIQNNMDKIKSKSIFIGNQNIDIKINLNKCLYLKDLKEDEKSYEFRQILLENVRNDYLYINIENAFIGNMLSIADWKYPNMDPMINQLKQFAFLIFISLIITFVPLLNLSFIASILLFIINILFLILSLCLALFSILSLITVYNYIKLKLDTIANNSKDKILFITVLMIQASLNASFLGEMLRPSLSGSLALCSTILGYKNDFSKLNEPKEDGKTEFRYNGLDSKLHSLVEIIIPGHPRYLYYSLNKDVINVNNNDNALNLNNNVNNNVNTNKYDEECELRISTKNF